MPRFVLLLVVLALASNVFAQKPSSRQENRRAERRQPLPPSTEAATVARNPFESGQKFQAVNRLDEILLESLKRKNLEPAPLCSDEVFVRRVFLDVIGTLPTPDEVRDFLTDKTPDKRTKLVDNLLRRNEFADYWAMKWSDVLRVKAEFPVNLWPNGAANYYRWIHEAIRTDKPYDRFVYELLTADGSNFRDGPVNFYRAVSSKDADTLAETVAQTFLGMRTGPWPDKKRKELAVFFSRVGYKETAQWKEEIVYWTRKPLDSPEVVFPDGAKGNLPENRDPRKVFADWLVSPNNADFNRCIANRVWFWLFGFGLVHEPDDFRADNPPVHSELLDYLAGELVAAKYDLKSLYRLILTSNAYQQSAIHHGKKTPQGEAETFASYPIRRLEAEVLQDALAQIFDVPVVYQSEVPEPFTFIPSRFRTIMLPDASVTSSFLEMFGRASRDTGLESDRNDGVTESQQLFFLNSTEVNTWIQRFLWKFRFAGRRPEDRRKALEEVWLTILSRYPTPEELRIVVNNFQHSEEPQLQKVQDLVWALLNSKEFLCKH